MILQDTATSIMFGMLSKVWRQRKSFGCLFQVSWSSCNAAACVWFKYKITKKGTERALVLGFHSSGTGLGASVRIQGKKKKGAKRCRAGEIWVPYSSKALGSGRALFKWNDSMSLSCDVAEEEADQPLLFCSTEVGSFLASALYK